MAFMEELEKKLRKKIDGINEIRKSGKLESALNGQEIAHQLIFAEMDILREIEIIKREEEEKLAAIAEEEKKAEADKQAELDEQEKAKMKEAQKELDSMISTLGIKDYLKK